MFPVRYELNFYILFRRNSAFKVLNNLSCHPLRTVTLWLIIIFKYFYSVLIALLLNVYIQ
jgi:hypothetical protein